MIETNDIEAITEIAARIVLKVLAEQASGKVEEPEQLGWQAMSKTARVLNIEQWRLGRWRRDGIFKLNVEYKPAPQPKSAQSPRYLFHVENCAKKLGVKP